MDKQTFSSPQEQSPQIPICNPCFLVHVPVSKVKLTVPPLVTNPHHAVLFGAPPSEQSGEQALGMLLALLQ